MDTKEVVVGVLGAVLGFLGGLLGNLLKLVMPGYTEQAEIIESQRQRIEELEGCLDDQADLIDRLEKQQGPGG